MKRDCCYTGKSVQEDIRLTGQFCFWVIRLTGQLENLDRLTCNVKQIRLRGQF